MSITIANITFDNVDYDAGADVLYLHRGDPRTAVDFDESPEGHALRYDASGQLVGITIVNARWLLEQDGKIEITLPPQHIDVVAAQLDDALAAA
jgi:YD repeat-containing protein